MVSEVRNHKLLPGMMVSGYTVSIYSEEGRVHYGMFETREAALNWIGDLDGWVDIMPIYAPSWNRG